MSATADREMALVSLNENASQGSNDRVHDPANDNNNDDMEYENGGGEEAAKGSNNRKEDEEEEESRPPANKRKRYGSGLGNLGNTCFMNSTLQCLAHTAPLRRYFIRGEYENDLNRDNPLGTGGDLASQFASLLQQMWGTAGNGGSSSSTNGGGLYGSSRPSGGGGGYYSSSNYDSSSVVYPRDFKHTLGKHAEQFMGYDQHDSQELATYLLDALHEDTNRVTKKPYIEKPEQGEDETDDVAARKSWDLHLQREDSRVLESFMGQVKSRVQCPRETCGRVSTTFDPFMYLSVPIPGATDRTIPVTYLPLDPKHKMKKLNVTLGKMSTVSALQKKIVDLLNGDGEASSSSSSGPPDEQEQKHGGGADLVRAEDICVADVWSHEVYSFYSPDHEIDRIRDSDVTFAFQLRSVSSVHKEEGEEEGDGSRSSKDEPNLDSEDTPVSKSKSGRERARLDPATVDRLDQVDQWTRALEKYVSPVSLAVKMNANRSTHEERIQFYERMEKFVRQLRKCPDSVVQRAEEEEVDAEMEGSGPAAPTPITDEIEGRGVTDEDFDNDFDEIDDEGPSLAERCQSSMFNGIDTAYDLAVFDFCSRKFYQLTVDIANEKKNKYKDGLNVQIVFKRQDKSPSLYRSSVGIEKTFATALVLRISPRLTVHGLRQVLSERLSRVLKFNVKEQREDDTKVASDADVVPVKCEPAESNDMEEENGSSREASANSESVSPPNNTEEATKPPEATFEASNAMDIMRQIPMTYERKSSSHHYTKTNTSYRSLGSLMKGDESHLGAGAIPFASPTDEGEQDIVADMVGMNGAVHLHWPPGLVECSFDEDEWEAAEDTPKEEKEAGKNKSDKKVTVTDCISKYCQMEQLEETEMWYCSKCKDHVRAWKQFHVYRAPPILIVHLKRFHYSSTTHRRDKIDTFIDFPLTDLDLSREAMHWEKGQEPIYDCYAVSNHYGGLGGGHYTAYAVSDDGAWCHFDDSRVTTSVSEKEVVSSAAYVLYYRRKDVSVEDVDEKEDSVVVSEQELDGDVSYGVPTSLGAKLRVQNSTPHLVSKIEQMDVDTDGVTSGNSSGTTSVDGESMSDDGNRRIEDMDALLLDKPAQ